MKRIESNVIACAFAEEGDERGKVLFVQPVVASLTLKERHLAILNMKIEILQLLCIIWEKY